MEEDKTNFLDEKHLILKFYREMKGMTQPYLGERAKISQALISKIETGKQNITEDVFMKAAEVLGFQPFPRLKLLFNIDPKYYNDFKIGIFSNNLRQEFSEKGLTLFRNVTIEEGGTSAQWVIRDKESGLVYLAKEENNTIEIYSKAYLEDLLGEIVEQYSESFYWLRDNFALSFRLIGADDEFFPISTLHIRPDVTAYEIPKSLLSESLQKEVETYLIEKAKKDNLDFFNGPNTRLINFRSTSIDETEQKHLEMTLGPINWYDFSIVRWASGQLLNQQKIEEICKYVNLHEAENGIINNNKFPNILCTATIILTSDGFLLWAKRGMRVSTEQGLSCIAENIHQKKDRSLEYQIKGDLPAPFKAVIRGIKEEASPVIAKHVCDNPLSIFLLGLDFNLGLFHPSLLFMVVIPFTFDRFQEICREKPGKDYWEGKIQPVSWKEEAQLDSLLSDPRWFPTGKASLIRTNEFLEAVEHKNPGINFNELSTMLMVGKTVK